MPPFPNQPYYNNAVQPPHQAGFNTTGVGQTVQITGYDSSAMPGLTNSSILSTNESMHCSDNPIQKSPDQQQQHLYNQQGQQGHQQQQQPHQNGPPFNPAQGFFPQPQQHQHQQQEHLQLYPFFGAQQQQQHQQQQQQPQYLNGPPAAYPLPQPPQNALHPFQQQQQPQFHQPQPWQSPSAAGVSAAGTHGSLNVWMTPPGATGGSGATSTLPLNSFAGGDSSAMPSLMMDDSKSAPSSDASTGASPPSPSRPPAVAASHHPQQQGQEAVAVGAAPGGGGGNGGHAVGFDHLARKQLQHSPRPPAAAQPQLQHGFQQQQQQQQQHHQPHQQQWQLHAQNLGEDPLVHLGLAPLDPDADYELTTVLNFFKPQVRYQLPPVPEYEFNQFTNRQMAFKGGNGQIRKVWWQPQGIHVILKSLIDKVVKPGRTTQEDLFNKEVLIMNSCNGHENIVRFYGISTRSGTGQRDGERYMVMHFYEQGDLTSLLRRAYPGKDKQGHMVAAEITLSWREKLQLSLDVALGLQHLFRNGFHHGDLHPKNVLIDTIKDDPNRRFRALLTDFGLSKVAQSNRDFSSQEVAGVWAFMAPERLPAKHPRFDVRCDIFALGVVSWQITSGHYPFGGSPTYLPGREKPVPGTPEGFVQFYQQAWSERPDDRQQSLDEVVSQLESLLRETDGCSRSSGEGPRQHDVAGSGAAAGQWQAALSPPPQSGDCQSPLQAGAAAAATAGGGAPTPVVPSFNPAAPSGYPSPNYSSQSMNTTPILVSSTSSSMSTSSTSSRTQGRPLHPNHPNNRPAPSIPGLKPPSMMPRGPGGGGGGSGLSPDQHGGNRPRANSGSGRTPHALQQLEDQRRYQQNLGQGYGYR